MSRMRCSTPPARTSLSSPASRGSLHDALSMRVEPIRVVVRLRPVREDLAPQSDGEDGAGGGEGGARAAMAKVWRVTSGEQPSIYLLPGTPRVSPWVFGSGGGCSGGAPPAIGGPCGSGGLSSKGGIGSSSSLSEAPARNYERTRFSFDHCFDGRATNQEVFDIAAKPVLRACFDGVNATLLAYGQTNSGKTHSILGHMKQPGALPLAMQDLFKADNGARMAGLVARVSYFEIFNERVTDLLSPTCGEQLKVKECPDRGFYVEGLREAPVNSAKDVLRFIEQGESRRKYSQTRWNDYSSRSHVLFTLSLERPLVAAGRSGFAELPSNSSAAVGAGDTGILPGRTVKVSIVDLAGCENHKLEQSEDGRYINRSLFFLGEVISRLCAASVPANRQRGRDGTPTTRSRLGGDAVGGGSSRESTPSRTSASVSPSRGRSSSRGGRAERQDFIPYRDSKLTRILRSSLGGNAMTLLLVTVHPSLQFVEQSMTSLRFATKARSVENCVTFGPGPEETAIVRGDERSTIEAQQRMIEGLQRKLRALQMNQRSGGGGVDRLSAPLPPTPSWDVPSRGRGVIAGGTTRAEVDERMIQQFCELRQEIGDREAQLEEKMRLLREREWQLGQLQSQLVESGGGALPLKLESPSAAAFSAASVATSLTVAAAPLSQTSQVSGMAQRHGPPDEGGGLPVVDCGRHVASQKQPKLAQGSYPPQQDSVVKLDNNQHVSTPASWTDVAVSRSAGSRDQGDEDRGWMNSRRSAGHPTQFVSPSSYVDVVRPCRHATSNDDVDDMPTVHQQVQSRAEDVVCLRQREQYVRRNQNPVTPPSSACYPPGGVSDHHGLGGGSESQNKLVEKLLFLAVQQINSVARPHGVRDDRGQLALPQRDSRDSASALLPSNAPTVAQRWAKSSLGEKPTSMGLAGAKDLPPPSNPNVQGTPRRSSELEDFG